MNVSEVERINNLINKAEIESAKAQGQMEIIKNSWKKEYGTDDEKEIRKKHKDLEEEQKKTQERIDVIYNKLLESCDWDALEEELN